MGRWCAVQVEGNSLFCILQPVMYTLSPFCTPSACTAHNLYRVRNVTKFQLIRFSRFGAELKKLEKAETGEKFVPSGPYKV